MSHGTPHPSVAGALHHASPVLIPPAFQYINSVENWRKNWSTIVTGKYSDSPFSTLLCYERAKGLGAFYQTDGAGGLQLLRAHTGWRDSWTHIVPGRFGNSGYDGVLFYDQQAGFAAFYDTDGHGKLIKLREHSSWRTSWSHILAAPFDDSEYSGLLLYDQSAGFGAIYATDGHGKLTLLREHSDWRTTWTAIVAGQMSSKQPQAGYPILADLFFLEGSTGYGETYATDGHGRIIMLGQQSGFPQASDIVGGNFGCMGNFQEWTNLLFFNRPTNVGTVFTFGVFNDGTQDANTWKPVETIQPQPPEPIIVAYPAAVGRFAAGGPMIPTRPWSLIATGNFWMVDPDDGYFGTNGKRAQYRQFYNGGCTDLLFYDGQEGSIRFYLKETAQTTPQEPLTGYVSNRSAIPGDTIDFHISSQVGTYRIDVYRQGTSRMFMANVPVDPGVARPYGISRTAYRDGAQWPIAGSLTIPSHWPSGLYLARVHAWPYPFTDPDTQMNVLAARGPQCEEPAAQQTATAARFALPERATYDIPFVIRPTATATRKRILLAVADTTYDAYNYWGGRSLYGHGCSGLGLYANPAIGHIWTDSSLPLPRGFRISFRRPFASAVGVKRMQTFEIPLIQWLERNGLHVDVCAVSDLHRQDDLLSNYKLFVSVGHDEYWSKEMRDQVEGFVKRGGNAAFFSGNICWWAVRFEDDGQTMICFKDKVLDPETVLWDDLHRSPRSMTGADGYTVWPNFPPDPPIPTQYFVVDDASHWAFEQTGLSNGDTFGVYLRPDGVFGSVVGPETDDGGKKGVLASATYLDATNKVQGIGTMVSFQKDKGTVFNAATINWVLGLSQQPGVWNTIDQITMNVFHRLG